MTKRCLAIFLCLNLLLPSFYPLLHISGAVYAQEEQDVPEPEFVEEPAPAWEPEQPAAEWSWWEEYPVAETVPAEVPQEQVDSCLMYGEGCQYTVPGYVQPTPEPAPSPEPALPTGTPEPVMSSPEPVNTPEPAIPFPSPDTGQQQIDSCLQYGEGCGVVSQPITDAYSQEQATADYWADYDRTYASTADSYSLNRENTDSTSADITQNIVSAPDNVAQTGGGWWDNFTSFAGTQAQNFTRLVTSPFAARTGYAENLYKEAEKVEQAVENQDKQQADILDKAINAPAAEKLAALKEQFGLQNTPDKEAVEIIKEAFSLRGLDFNPEDGSIKTDMSNYTPSNYDFDWNNVVAVDKEGNKLTQEGLAQQRQQAQEALTDFTLNLSQIYSTGGKFLENVSTVNEMQPLYDETGMRARTQARLSTYTGSEKVPDYFTNGAFVNGTITPQEIEDDMKANPDLDSPELNAAREQLLVLAKEKEARGKEITLEVSAALLMGSVGGSATLSMLEKAGEKIAVRSAERAVGKGITEDLGELAAGRAVPAAGEVDSVFVGATQVDTILNIQLTPEWGQSAVQEQLALARRYSITHGEEIITKLKPYLPPETKSAIAAPGLSIQEKADIIQSQLKNFSEDDLRAIAQGHFENPILNEVEYHPQDYFNLNLPPRQSEVQQVLKGADGIESVSSTLFGDGQEMTSVKQGGEWFVARIKNTDLPIQEVEENIRSLPSSIPQTRVVSQGEGNSGKVVLFSKKIENGIGAEVSEDEAIKIARELGNSGIVADLHLGNFVKDVDGKVWYVDQDVFEHVLSGEKRVSSPTIKQQVEEEITRFQGSAKNVTLDSPQGASGQFYAGGVAQAVPDQSVQHITTDTVVNILDARGESLLDDKDLLLSPIRKSRNEQWETVDPKDVIGITKGATTQGGRWIPVEDAETLMKAGVFDFNKTDPGWSGVRLPGGKVMINNGRHRGTAAVKQGEQFNMYIADDYPDLLSFKEIDRTVVEERIKKGLLDGEIIEAKDLAELGINPQAYPGGVVRLHNPDTVDVSQLFENPNYVQGLAGKPIGKAAAKEVPKLQPLHSATESLKEEIGQEYTGVVDIKESYAKGSISYSDKESGLGFYTDDYVHLSYGSGNLNLDSEAGERLGTAIQALEKTRADLGYSEMTIVGVEPRHEVFWGRLGYEKSSYADDVWVKKITPTEKILDEVAERLVPGASDQVVRDLLGFTGYNKKEVNDALIARIKAKAEAYNTKITDQEIQKAIQDSIQETIQEAEVALAKGQTVGTGQAAGAGAVLPKSPPDSSGWPNNLGAFQKLWKSVFGGAKTTESVKPLEAIYNMDESLKIPGTSEKLFGTKIISEQGMEVYSTDVSMTVINPGNPRLLEKDIQVLTKADGANGLPRLLFKIRDDRTGNLLGYKIEKPASGEYENFRLPADLNPASRPITDPGVEKLLSVAEDNWIENGFVAKEAVNKTKGPAIEVAGPTERGYSLVNAEALDKKLQVSNIKAKGVKYCEGVVQGEIDFQADAVNLPLVSGSVGSLFASCLPKEVRIGALNEAQRVLEDGGLFVYQGVVTEDILRAEKLGFKLVQFRRHNNLPPGFWNGELSYDVILQKGNVKGVSVAAVSNQGVTVDVKTFEFLVKKNLIKNALLEDGKVSSEYVKSVLALDILQPEIKKNSDGYLLTTGKAGTVEGQVEKTLYKVAVNPLPGVDIEVPAVVDLTKDSSAIVAVRFKKGSGKVEKVASRPGRSLVGTVYADETKDATGSAQVKVVLTGEKGQVLPWAGVNVSLEKVEQQSNIHLNAGWNLVTLTALPGKPLTASNLLDQITAQGGNGVAVSTLENGAWKTFVSRGTNDYSTEDFLIEPGKAYFVKALKPSKFTFTGQNFVEPIKLKLSSGWNAVGMPVMSKPNKASDLNVDTVARWDFGLWDTFVKKDAEKFGEDFAITAGRGYILKVGKEMEFSP